MDSESEDQAILEEVPKLLILKTIANRINSDIKVKASLSTIYGKSSGGDLDKMPALNAVLLHACQVTEQLVRASVFRTLRRYLNDDESIERELIKNKFTMDQLQEELEKIQSILETNELQVSSQLPELDDLSSEEHLVYDETGFRRVSEVKLEEFELPPFMNTDLTFSEDGTPKIILPPGKEVN